MIISFHIIPCHCIPYHFISYHVISYIYIYMVPPPKNLCFSWFCWYLRYFWWILGDERWPLICVPNSAWVGVSYIYTCRYKYRMFHMYIFNQYIVHIKIQKIQKIQRIQKIQKIQRIQKIQKNDPMSRISGDLHVVCSFGFFGFFGFFWF